MRRPLWRRLAMPCFLVLWMLALIPGYHFLSAYAYTPGEQSAALGTWPADVDLDASGLRPASFEETALETGGTAAAALPTIVVALHPRCTCSRATLAELEQAAAGFDRPYRAVLLVYQPQGADQAWQAANLYSDAQKALHARVVMDTEGRIAASFGARTSGEVFLYTAGTSPAQRRLLFAGGVSAGRGQIGDNPGLTNFKAAFRAATDMPKTTALPMQAVAPRAANTSTRALAVLRAPVYGCGLFAHAQSSRQGGGE